MWDEHNTRKPILLLRLFGWLLLRVDERTLSGLLFQEPPRNTRFSSQGTPQIRKSICIVSMHYSEQKKSIKLRAAPLRGAQGAATQRFSVQHIGDPLFDGGRTQHPKTEIVVTIDRMVVVTRRRTHKVWIIVPGTTAQHTILVAFRVGTFLYSAVRCR